MGKPFIKLLHTINSGYFYDVNRNELVEVSDEGYQYLQNVLEDRAVMEDAPEDVKRLKKAGYLSDHHVKEIKHPMTDYIRDLLAQNIGTITLQLTQDCNFRCEYCVYSDTESNIGQRQHSRKKMSLDTAKSAVCFLRDHAIGVKKLNIGFYGGEPLLQFQLIKDIILFAEEELFGKEVAYSITTNGSLLKGEVLDFLKEHQVSVNLSFDGPKPIQDNNRRLARSDASTYDLVYRNVRKAYEKYPEYVKTFFVHMVIVPTYEFDEIEAFFDTPILNQMMFTGSLVDDHYSSNKHPMAKTFHAKTQYQNFLAYLYVLERLDREKISPLVRESISHNLQKTEGILGGRGIPAIGSPAGQCVPGETRPFCDVDGNLYPCERVSESAACMKIGNIYDGFDYEQVSTLLNVPRITAEECKQCEAFQFCGLCISACEKDGCLSKATRLSHCRDTRAELEVCMRLLLLKKEQERYY